jgi:hypothetical protein
MAAYALVQKNVPQSEHFFDNHYKRTPTERSFLLMMGNKLFFADLAKGSAGKILAESDFARAFKLGHMLPTIG